MRAFLLYFLFPFFALGADRPNVVIIQTDEHNLRTLGCYRDQMSPEQVRLGQGQQSGHSHRFPGQGRGPLHQLLCLLPGMHAIPGFVGLGSLSAGHRIAQQQHAAQ